MLPQQQTPAFNYERWTAQPFNLIHAVVDAVVIVVVVVVVSAAIMA